METTTEAREAVQTLDANRPTPQVQSYQYYDDKLDVIWVTSVPKDDEAAIAYFHTVMRFGKEYWPKYVAKRQSTGEYKALPVTFDCETLTTDDRR